MVGGRGGGGGGQRCWGCPGTGTHSPPRQSGGRMWVGMCQGLLLGLGGAGAACTPGVTPGKCPCLGEGQRLRGESGTCWLWGPRRRTPRFHPPVLGMVLLSPTEVAPCPLHPCCPTVLVSTFLHTPGHLPNSCGAVFFSIFFFVIIVVVVVIYTLVRFQASTETLWVNLGSNCKTKTKMFSPPRSP